MAMWQSRQSWVVVYGCGAHLAVWVDGDVAVLTVLGGVGPAATGDPQPAALLTLVLAEAAVFALVRCPFTSPSRLATVTEVRSQNPPTPHSAEVHGVGLVEVRC